MWLETWQAALAANVTRARQLLREILAGPLTLTPGTRSYRFEGEFLLGGVLTGSSLIGAAGGT